jgi:hypothetical protein
VGDVLSSLLPYLPGVPFGAAVVVLFRLWTSAVRDVRDERADHNRTQDLLDVERAARRQVEDKVDVLTREVRHLTEEVARLRKAVGEST